MGLPQKLEGSKYQMLRIRNTYLVFWTNGGKRLIENLHFYGPGQGVCGGYQWSAGQKTGLVTYSTGISTAGVAGVPSGITNLYGFQTTVLSALNQVLSLGALPAGIYAKWIDVVNDFDAQVGTLAVPGGVGAATAATTPAIVASPGLPSGGQVGTLANRMPLDNHVTFRKATGVAGHEWSKGRWKFAPLSETQVAGDELTAGAQTAWGTTTYGSQASSLKSALYCPITDGTSAGGVANVMYPCLVSMKLSQLRRSPTRICYAPLVLPGLNYATQLTNQIINATIGEQKKRKEKPDVVF